MRLASVGTVVDDRILHTDGTETRSLGGIYYTVAVAANLCPPEWEILPICRAGQDILPRLEAKLGRYPNVNLRWVQPSRRANTRVTLVYRTALERDEYTTPPMAPLSAGELEPALDTDACLVNFITGRDVKLSALSWFAEQYLGLLYLDLHSLTLGIGPDGKRYARYPQRWRSYARVPDVLQMNEREAACLSRKPMKSGSFENVIAFFRDFLDSSHTRPAVVNVTLGPAGSAVLWRSPDDGVRAQRVPPAAVEVVDPTGCGDTFAVGFLYSYLLRRDPVEAARYANLVAGLKCCLKGSEGLPKLRTLLDRMKGGTAGQSLMERPAI